MEKWKFGIDNNKLVDLVINGKKSATSSIYIGNKPNIKDKQIILYDDNKNACMIEIINTTILKFKDFTLEMILKEGEDDSLDSWRYNHINFFKNEIKDFNEDTFILFEEFKCIKIYK